MKKTEPNTLAAFPSSLQSSGGSLLCQRENFELTRRGRFVVAHLLEPHLVLSTSYVNGGEQTGLRYLVNHQACEAKEHAGRHETLTKIPQDDYHLLACEEAGLPPETTTLLSTAANMQYATVVEETFEEMAVCAVVTAGVEGNAGRAGDPSSWHEAPEGIKPLHAIPGTINTILLFNWPLTPAALARSVVTMTEAKSAVLQELSIRSRYSEGIATGTGTDQFAVASPMDEKRKPKNWTGKHAKLGELIGQAVMKALREALRWQNGLEPSLTRSVFHALSRFGLSEPNLQDSLKTYLSEAEFSSLLKNWKSFVFEPQVAACAYAMAEVMDRVRFGVLPQSSAREALLHQGALLAVSAAAKPGNFSRMREVLLPFSEDWKTLVSKALALGFSEKWK